MVQKMKMKMKAMRMTTRKAAVRRMNKRLLVKLMRRSELRYKLPLVQQWWTWKKRFVLRETLEHGERTIVRQHKRAPTKAIKW